ncbi:G-protein coupled receptor 61-like [Gigantopelta aegis]|uniref:G-protein coupled receptor 61-like n=1 Tax=Gigantopelta aegis TaxID=1735272 RepID=UPI001B889784|nr:G-protein coupled receptor 61-like [Gigantopelta aegis]
MNNTTTATEADGDASRYVVLVLMCLVNLTAVVGNVSIIVVVLRCFQLRHTLTNFFVLNLSVVDLLGSVVALPVGISSFLHDAWPYGSRWCVVSGAVTSFSVYASICSLCLISVERYYSIKLPMHHAANMSLQKTVCALVFVWVQNTVLAVLPVLGVNSYTYQDHKKHCSVTWQGPPSNAVFVLFISVWCFLVPGVILLLMHCGIFRVAREAARQIRPYPSTPTVSVLVGDRQSDSQTTEHVGRVPVRCTRLLSWCVPGGDDSVVPVVERSMSAHLFQHTPRPYKGHLKAIKTLIIIFSSFLLLWGPYFVLHAYGAITGYVARRATSELVTTWLGYTTFAVNPLLYGWMNRAIRQELIAFYQNDVCFCLHAAGPPPGHSDAPREHEDFIQFLERTSYKAVSPNQNSRAVKVAENSARTHREHVHTVNKEQTHCENVNDVNKERTHCEHVHTVNKEQTHCENVNNVNNERTHCEHVHTVNKEHTHCENFNNVNNDRTHCEHVHPVNKEQTHCEHVNNMNNEQTHCEHVHTVNREQTHCENVNVNNERTHCEHIQTVNKKQTHCEHINNMDNERTHCEHVHTVKGEGTHCQHVHTMNKNRTHCEHTVNNERTQHKHVIVINSERIQKETVIIVNSEQKHESAVSLNNERTHGKPGSTVNDEPDITLDKEQIHCGPVHISNKE